MLRHNSTGCGYKPNNERRNVSALDLGWARHLSLKSYSTVQFARYVQLGEFYDIQCLDFSRADIAQQSH
ncbi:Uncharacterised protein [Acinetobacter baumannii]|nr:Uncharacterised protein [Acinetobacter baumannii]SSU40243.1 Uncharacterised protein [Acinetobacter baumannii]